MKCAVIALMILARSAINARCRPPSSVSWRLEVMKNDGLGIKHADHPCDLQPCEKRPFPRLAQDDANRGPDGEPMTTTTTTTFPTSSPATATPVPTPMFPRIMEKSLKTFFTSPQFAVVGASSNPVKFGHKVFVWYLSHSLPVTPINPRAPSISVRSKSYQTLASPSALPSPTKTSLSVITPPKATLQILKEAREVGIPAVWLQPGTYDDAVKREAEEFEKGGGVVIWGMEGGTCGDEGWCVLVDGEYGLQEAGRKWERVKL